MEILMPLSSLDRAMLLTCVDKEIAHIEEELPSDGTWRSIQPDEVEDAERRLEALRALAERLHPTLP